MLVFEPNPGFRPDGGELVTSLSGMKGGGKHYVLILSPDGGLSHADWAIQEVPLDAGSAFQVFVPGWGLNSWSANLSGHSLMAQALTDDLGNQVCSSFGEGCGIHGPCCVGLSCQAADGGCACLYAWPCFPAGTRCFGDEDCCDGMGCGETYECGGGR